MGGGAKLEMVLIPAGEFLMGSSVSDARPYEKQHRVQIISPSEKPQHRVRITKPFYLGKYLVTQEQWQAVMGNNPSEFKGPKNPVERVSWDDCQKFLEKLNAKIGTQRGKFVLPTEAQWEYACRRGARRAIALETMSRGWASMRGIMPTRRRRRTRWARRNRTLGGCMTCTETCRVVPGLV